MTPTQVAARHPNSHDSEGQDTALVVVFVREAGRAAPLRFRTPAEGYSFSIDEDGAQPSLGRELGRLSLERSDQVDRARFSIVDGDPHGWFRLDPLTGVLSTAAPLDRERSQQLTLGVVANTLSFFARTSVTVTLRDVNDNAPSFAQPLVRLGVPESWPPGLELYVPDASDADDGVNAELEYALASGPAGLFAVEHGSGMLRLLQPVRLQAGKEFALEITVSDKGQPRLASRQKLVVTVKDVNDHTPTFERPSYETSLLELTNVNERFFTLRAWDADQGDNGRVSYEISEGNDEGRFGVFPDGTVYVKKALDREWRDLYALTVVARDHGEPPRSSAISLLVHVLDENDNAPAFDNSTFVFSLAENEPPDTHVVVHITDVNDNAPVFSRPNYRASVSEAASPGTTVARVSATDADEGRNGELLYAIAAGNEAGAFAIDEASGQLSLASPLDRETAGAYTLMVIARDTGAELQHTATATVLVQVLDENDNAPEFAPRALRADVPETTPIGYELHRFSATDRDLGLNGEVSFSIVSGNVKEAFKVDSTTGALFLDRPLDYEQQSVYQLNVTASDGGSPRQAVSVGFTVRVLDVNDNPPQFANVAIVRQIEEGLPLHTPVVTVTAVDRDAGANGKLTYAITSQEPPGAHFSVRQDSGVVFTAAEIDREFSDTFRLTLTATDQGSPSLSSHKTVTIIVEDVNDNTPTFVSVDAGILPEDSEKGYVIMKLEAVDADANANGQVTYELVDGDKSLFAVDRSTGELSLLRAVSRPAVSYSLAVQASDQAVPSQRKSSRVHLTVLGANKRSQPLPAFSAPHYSATVPENQPAGTSVLSVRAQGTPQGRVQYFLTSVRAAASGALAGRRFTVHRDSGLVTTAAALDREAGSDVFQLELLAVDASAKVPRTAKASLCSCVVLCLPNDHLLRPASAGVDAARPSTLPLVQPSLLPVCVRTCEAYLPLALEEESSDRCDEDDAGASHGDVVGPSLAFSAGALGRRSFTKGREASYAAAAGGRTT
ncbi:hypothetical protein HPB51_016934 [Rhipicephalus microplus]|uniref:Cadherin domain-containing protein n=1 Tax=Rhipicephalus microplus TaxID=6941 RepID=A0A9J6F4I9_RHIMP|nr:hypothetical protein HPB51_016934 [Rhipicephalus microplus]